MYIYCIYIYIQKVFIESYRYITYIYIYIYTWLMSWTLCIYKLCTCTILYAPDPSFWTETGEAKVQKVKKAQWKYRDTPAVCWWLKWCLVFVLKTWGLWWIMVTQQLSQFLGCWNTTYIIGAGAVFGHLFGHGCPFPTGHLFFAGSNPIEQSIGQWW